MYAKLFYLIGEYIHLSEPTNKTKLYFKDLSVETMKKLN
jgi:hypothetical protein